MPYCNQCGNKIEDNSKFCGNCGATMVNQPVQQTQQHYARSPQRIKHSGFGIAGLVLGIISVVMSSTLLLWFIGFILGILAIIFGAIAYWGKPRDKYGLAGFICGLVAVIVAMVWFIISARRFF